MFYLKKEKKNEKNSRFYRLCRRLQTSASFLPANASAQKSGCGAEFKRYTYYSDFTSATSNADFTVRSDRASSSSPIWFNVFSYSDDFNA